MSMLIAGDVGGTKTRLGLYRYEGAMIRNIETKRYDSRVFSSFRDMVRLFLEQTATVSVAAACFGVPGPIVKGAARLINLPWELSEDELSDSLNIRPLRLVNDLAATTAAIPLLKENDLALLHGVPQMEQSVSVVLAPGTGLGQGYLHWVEGTAHVIASEGGHSDFAPNRPIEIELLKYLLIKHKRVSYERVLSGPGLVNIYSFLKDTGFAAEREESIRRFALEDRAAVISDLGMRKADAICVETLDIFSSILGAQAGNLVLSLMATGGVYLGGGIPPKILPKLRDGTLLSAYLNKGRLSPLVAATPLYVIKDDQAALLGAAHLAMKSLKV